MKSFLKCLFSINPISLTFCSILFVVILFLVNVPILDMIELRTYDLRLLSRQARQPTSSIVLAIVDEKSLDTEGRWPWPRSTIAALVDRLSKDQAKVIAFDIGFLEPDENTQLQLINELGQHIHRLSIDNKSLSDFIQQRKQHADNDQTLADAIQHASAHVIVAIWSCAMVRSKT
jgi:adenylate cyclase